MMLPFFSKKWLRLQTSPVNICGKIIICEKCGDSLRVEYQGGAQVAELWDFSREKLLSKSAEFGQPHENPEVDGFYIYFFATCSCCVDQEIISKTKRLNELIDELHSEREAYLFQMNDTINNVLSDVCVAWDTFEQAEEILKTKLQHLRSQKKREKALKDIVSKNYERFRDQVLQNLNGGEVLSTLQVDFKQKCKEKYKKMLKELSQAGMVDRVLVIDPRSSDSLDCSSKGTNDRRVPVDETPDVLFFKEQKINRSQVDQLMILTDQDIKAYISELTYERLLENAKMLF